MKGLARADCVLLADSEDDAYKGLTVLISKIEIFYKIVRNHLKYEMLKDAKKYTLLVVPPVFIYNIFELY